MISAEVKLFSTMNIGGVLGEFLCNPTKPHMGTMSVSEQYWQMVNDPLGAPLSPESAKWCRERVGTLLESVVDRCKAAYQLTQGSPDYFKALLKLLKDYSSLWQVWPSSCCSPMGPVLPSKVST